MEEQDPAQGPSPSEVSHQPQTRLQKNQNNAKFRFASIALKDRFEKSLSPVTVGEDDGYTFTEQSVEA